MKYITLWILKAYKILVSPILLVLFGPGCRFTPTCSEYTIQSVAKYGTMKGIIMGAKRLARCHF